MKGIDKHEQLISLADKVIHSEATEVNDNMNEFVKFVVEHLDFASTENLEAVLEEMTRIRTDANEEIKYVPVQSPKYLENVQSGWKDIFGYSD